MMEDNYMALKSNIIRGAWVAWSVKHLNLDLDFSSGHHLRAVKSTPTSGSVLGMDGACLRVSLSFCPFPPAKSSIIR